MEAILCNVTQQDMRMVVQRLGTLKGVLTLYNSCCIMLSCNNDYVVVRLV